MNQTDTRLKMLVVDDVTQNLELVCDVVAKEAVEVYTAATAEAALECFMQVRPKVVLSDLVLPGMNGLELLDAILVRDPGTDFILMTAYYSTDSAVDAIRRGAFDYLPKPLDVERLRKCIADLVQQSRMRQKTLHLDQDLLNVYQYQGMIGRSPLMLEVFSKIRRIAPHFRSALVTGATGTGKELVARALHNLSPGATQPFAVCNCSALVETLLESQLFGYVRGAFTGAVQDKLGVFEYANGGTVFLDEVGELPLSAQSKLLRVLQNSEVQRVGSPVSRQVDVRVVAATNRDLRKMVADGTIPERSVLSLVGSGDSHPEALATKRKPALAATAFSGKILRHVPQGNYGIYASRPGALVVPRLAGKRARTGKRREWQLHHVYRNCD